MTAVSKIQIYVACHKPTYVPEHEFLVPVQVGTALAEKRYPGMRCDNDGENISDKNSQYCELTAQYWAWKNEDCDYYGFFHYRRYLSFGDVYSVSSEGSLSGGRQKRPYVELDDIREDLSIYKLDSRSMEIQIVQYDLMTVLRERINTTVYRQFCQYHKKENLDQVVSILKRKYPEYESAAECYLNSKDIYYMNMYIMKKSLFDLYMSWLFDILSEFEQEYRKTEQFEPRLMGYLAERLFGIFYIYQREHGAKCAELAYLKFYNTELDKNAEPATSIRTFRLKPTKIELKVDMRKLNRLFPAGSRRRILLRSLFLR